jgi:hypothetical protein
MSGSEKPSPNNDHFRLTGISEKIGEMRIRRMAFTFFAAGILFSMIREWSAPVLCARPILAPAVATGRLR